MYEQFQPLAIANTRYLFFTGKGGVGKTSTACATAIALADKGKTVLIVSTDPASNLQDVFDIELTNTPLAIDEVQGLFAANLDPEQAANDYKAKVVGPYRGKLPDSVIVTMEEQLSGACTVEVAAFDQFTHLLANHEQVKDFDHIIFDTAPTGHTLRLLQLPTAWSGFLEKSTHGASCLGPLSGLAEKKELYTNAVNELSDAYQTTMVLVARPDESSLEEAIRASKELANLHVHNQLLLINGKLQTYVADDRISSAFYQRQEEALTHVQEEISDMKIFELPLVPFSLTGVTNLRQLFSDVAETVEEKKLPVLELPDLTAMVNELAPKQTGVLFTMGKGGVGKTTVAAAMAVKLAEKGCRVHLTTTDPAAHIDATIGSEEARERLTISKIDPKHEVEAYRKEVIAQVGSTLDEDALAYLQEDLNSPCTEEIAVFRALARVVEKSEHEFVVIDTAPTGHTLLLLDAAQSYHTELARSTGEVPESVKKLLPRLRNPDETSVVIVTLAEATPVFEAQRLQEDLNRAEIMPTWWVMNQSLLATETTDPVLKSRAVSEAKWIKKVNDELAKKCAMIPWRPEATIGYTNLSKL